MKPLMQSHAADALEAELKQLTIALWQEFLEQRKADINVYAAPHLGSKALLQKYLVSQGIHNFNVAALSEDAARYLLMAWRYRNPKRGTHFLRVFIRCLWGADFDIQSLWQKKSGTYPQDLVSEADMQQDGLNINDYFRTSRLRVVLYGESGYFPADIAVALNAILPARLFVAEVTRHSVTTETIWTASAAMVESTVEGYAQEWIQAVDDNGGLYFADDSEITSLITGTAASGNVSRG